VPLNSVDRLLRQFDGGHFRCRQRRCLFGGGLEAPFRFAQGLLPESFSTSPYDAPFL
jgi:hypothetical protein